jgi:hypothetical protein
MPYWLTTAHWQAQYPENLYCRTEITMKSVQAMSNPEDDLRFCPSWSGAKKKGRPKKNERIKSVMDHIKESTKKKRKRQVRIIARSATNSTTALRIAGRIQAIMMLEMVEMGK